MKYSARMSMLLAAAAASVMVACGSDGDAARDTLPAIVTTTTTTTMAPTTTTIPSEYEIKAGDSLSQIAKSFNLSTAALAAFNGITDYEHIEIGQVLKIPQPGDIITTTTVGPDAASTSEVSTTVTTP
ncbi:MAG: LysM peptidoglycan-binding domain-containing protein [Ilumatobacteraceae bacterium]